MATRGINKVILIGNLGNDPEIRKMPNGSSVCNLSLATSESWKDQNGQQQERTEWHRVTFYRKAADIIGQYSTKGSTLYIEGKLQTRKWQDQSGQDRYTTEIIGDQFQFLGGGQNNGQNNGQNSGQNNGQNNYNHQGGGYNQNQSSTAQGTSPQSPSTPDFENSFNDEIPF